MADKPMGVMPLCIIAIFLGILGVLGGGMGIVGMKIGQRPLPADKNPKITELNAEFQQRMETSTKQNRPLMVVVFPLVMLTSALLAVSGIVAIQMKGLGLLKIALASNLLVDLAAAVLQNIAQVRMMGIMKWYFHEVADLNNSGGAAPAVEMSMLFGIYASLFFAVFWLVLKLVYYVLGLVYFSKRAIVDAYSGRPSPEAAA